MLGTIVDKIQSLFSKGFLLGAFFPVLIFAVLNAAIAYFGLFPNFDVFGRLDWLWKQNAAWQSFLTGTVLIAIGILAYLMSTLTDVFRRLLEGRYFANWPTLWEWIMARVRQDVTAKQDALNGALATWTNRRRLSGQFANRLNTAMDAGNQPGVPGDAALVAAARQRVQALHTLDPAHANYDTPLVDAVTALEAALRANRTQNPAPAQLAIADELDMLYRTITNTEIKRWTQEAQRKYYGAWSNLYDSYVLDNLYPSRLGNLRAVAESYSGKTYGVSFEYLWPRLQPVILKNKEMSPLVELARANLDFALLMLSLAMITTAIWWVVLPIWGRSPWPFIAVGVIGPAVVAFCYLLVEESQILFGALMQSCVDIFRLDVLPLMHQPLPDTLSSERQRWQDLQRLPSAGGTIDLPFKHSPPA
jgi:hypothetical protein